MFSLTVGGGVENMVCTIEISMVCTIEISKTFVEYKNIIIYIILILIP